jgi:2-C-methyl-D-erythritol 4-phosphate cytidylyltransferase
MAASIDAHAARMLVILPAAGSGSRYGRNKLLEPLDGLTVLEQAARAFTHRMDVAAVYIGTPEHGASDLHEAIDRIRADADVPVATFIGGRNRGRTVAAGIAAAQRHPQAESLWLAVHDAARPFVPPHLITETFEAARRFGAAAPATPVTSTIKQTTGPLPAAVVRTLDRNTLYGLQTPQIGRLRDFSRAISQLGPLIDTSTDDLQLLELAGMPTHLINGDMSNIKITFPGDLPHAR